MPWHFYTGADPDLGRANGYLDCLDKVVTFLTNSNPQPALGTELTDLTTEGMDTEAWTVNRNTTSGFTVDGEVWLQGPGKAGLDEIHVGIETADKGNRFDWRLQGATSFDSLLDFDSQLGAIPNGGSFGTPFILLDDAIFDFYLIANGNRFIVIAFISSTVQVMYGGLAEAYGPPTPDRFPYPLSIIGTHSDPVVAISDTSNEHSWGFETQGVPVNSANKTGYLWSQQFGQWFTNVEYTTLNLGLTQPFFWTVPPQAIRPGPNPDSNPRPIGLTENDDRILYPAEILVNANQELSRIGFFDGVFWGTGIDQPLNQIEVESGIGYVGAHNTFRNQWHRYLFFKLT